MKEIQFEVRTRSEPYFVAPVGDVRAVSQTVHVPSDVLLQLWRLTGPPGDLGRFERVISKAGREPHLGNVVLHKTPRSLNFVAKWAPPDERPTFENLFGTLAWAKVLLRIHAEQGKVRVRALDEDADTLRDLYATIDDRFGERWEVRLARFGDLEESQGRDRGPNGTEELTETDLELLDLAITRGYYEEPKGCGVRELGDVVGLSKSAVSRRLRALERRALTDLRARHLRWPEHPARPDDLDMSRKD